MTARELYEAQLMGDFLSELMGEFLADWKVLREGYTWLHHNGEVLKLEHQSASILLRHIRTDQPVQLEGAKGNTYTALPGTGPRFVVVKDGVVVGATPAHHKAPYSTFKSKHLQELSDSAAFDHWLENSPVRCGGCEMYNGFEFGFVAEARKESLRQLKVIQNRRGCPDQPGYSCSTVNAVVKRQIGQTAQGALYADWVSPYREPSVPSDRKDDDPSGSNQGDRSERTKRGEY